MAERFRDRDVAGAVGGQSLARQHDDADVAHLLELGERRAVVGLARCASRATGQRSRVDTAGRERLGQPAARAVELQPDQPRRRVHHAGREPGVAGGQVEAGERLVDDEHVHTIALHRVTDIEREAGIGRRGLSDPDKDGISPGALA